MNKIFKGSADQAIQEILNIYHTNKTAVINYVYGFQIVKHKLLEEGTIYSIPYGDFNIKTIELDSDVLLPDGAALRTARLIGRLLGKRKGPFMIHNLNGTDFIPYFLSYLHNHNIPTNIITYTVYDPRLNNPKGYFANGAKKYLQDHRPHFNILTQEVIYADVDYNQFNRAEVEEFLGEHKNNGINIFLNFRGGSYGPLPHQELFSYTQKEKFKKYNILCFNQGATVDFRTGKETRAPKRIRALRLESVYRLFSNRKLNKKKFLMSFNMLGVIYTKIICGKKSK